MYSAINQCAIRDAMAAAAAAAATVRANPGLISSAPMLEEWKKSIGSHSGLLYYE